MKTANLNSFTLLPDLFVIEVLHLLVAHFESHAEVSVAGLLLVEGDDFLGRKRTHPGEKVKIRYNLKDRYYCSYYISPKFLLCLDYTNYIIPGEERVSAV